MKKMLKSALAVFFCVSIVFTCCFSGFAAGGATAPKTKYPYVFVHGMMGWGEGSNFESMMPYWGLSEESNVITHLRSEGYDVYYPSVGGLSSAWDRACELYAQLTGTVVDYGQAHSEKCGHARYGRDYTGKATMGEPWNYKNDKINLIGHSFGGATVRMLTHLLAYGDPAEQAVSGEACSGLFKGGNAGAINCCITLSAPHDGTIVSNYATDLIFPAVMIAFMMNFDAKTGFLGMDPMLDQWGISVDPASGEKVKLDIFNCIRCILSDDHCGKDMTLAGAAELNSYVRTVPETYYLSYTTQATTENFLGLQQPMLKIFPIFLLTVPLISLSRGMIVDGTILDKSWTPSDGIVPLRSALYPSSDENNHAEFTASSACVRGKWYTMPTLVGYDHYDFCKTTNGFENKENLFAFYEELIQTVEALS